MLCLLWDASALTKRFVEEIGSETVDALFALSNCKHAVTFLGYAETSAVLRRKYNQGVMTTRELMQARLLLERAVLNSNCSARMSCSGMAIKCGFRET